MLYMDLPVMLNTANYKTETVDFNYPQVVNLENKAAQRKINEEIFNLMNRVTRELKHPDQSIITIIDGSYEIKTNERSVLSLTLLAMGDFHGAHPMTFIRSITFDTKTGMSYELKDLFNPKTEYLKFLNTFTFAQLKERNYPLFEGSHTVKPNQDYFITDKNLIIYFQLYEIAPYAAGFPYATIPIYLLEEYLSQNSILKRFLFI